MPLRSAWVDALFSKLSVTYGRDFTARWDGLDLEAVKADWAHELAHYDDHPEAIKHALTILPADRPPTALQFRELCRSAPGPVFKALPGPAPDASRAAEARAMAAEAIRTNGQHPKAWVMRLIERADRGELVPVLSLRMAREALGLPAPARAHEAAEAAHA